MLYTDRRLLPPASSSSSGSPVQAAAEEVEGGGSVMSSRWCCCGCVCTRTVGNQLGHHVVLNRKCQERWILSLIERLIWQDFKNLLSQLFNWQSWVDNSGQKRKLFTLLKCNRNLPITSTSACSALTHTWKTLVEIKLWMKRQMFRLRQHITSLKPKTTAGWVTTLNQSLTDRWTQQMRTFFFRGEDYYWMGIFQKVRTF